MRCTACRNDNPEEARFCMHCGGPLATGGARSELAPGSYTPAHLTRKILTSRSALQGERKQVTVFFADVKGSVALSHQVDPERWHEILDRFFRILAEGIHRFEGTVNQFTGDGIMALFGAPIAHEDHAQRACYAALHLKQSLRRYADDLRRNEGLNFSVRMGLNSGEVVVGKIGDDLRMDYTAQGHTVGLAARIQAVAPPDCIYLGETTAAAVRGYFELEDLGSFDVKGAVAPIDLAALRGVGEFRSRLDLAKARGFSRFLGRDEFMGELSAALDAALEGRAQLVAFVGEAGVGKSRLAYEFLEQCRARGIPCTETHGVAHGRSIPLLPILGLYRAALGVEERDSPQQAREKIAGRVLLLDPELAASLPLVFDFLGVADPERPAPILTPEVRQRRLVDFDVRYSIARSKREPMVTLYEDLQFMDEASLSWLATLVERAAETRTLVIVNFRPEFLQDWKAMSAEPAKRLLPLGDQLARELMDSILGTDPQLAALKDRINSRTLGNPFFIEESVRAMVEAGRLVGETGNYRLEGSGPVFEIPSSVQSLLASRVDQLPDWEKLLLQTASVIGRRVSRPLLDELAAPHWGDLDSALETLCTKEFLVEIALYPDATYEFFHPLTREVAYASQLVSRRTRTHEAIARAIERIDQDRLGERAALLAHHWTEAGRPLNSAHWHHRAAMWMSTQNLAAAMSHLCTAREQLIEAEARTLLSEEHQELGLNVRLGLLEIGVRRGLPLREAREYLAEGRSLAESAGDRDQLCLLLVAFGKCCIFGADFECGLAALREAEEVAESCGSPELLASVNLTAAWSVMARGHLQEALHLNRRALENLVRDASAAEPTKDASTHASLLAMRTGILRYLGRTKEAMEVAALVEAMDASPERAEWIGVVHGIRSAWEVEGGRFDSALMQAHRFREIGKVLDNKGTLIHGQQAVSRVHSARGEWNEALRAGIASLEDVRESGILGAEIGALCCIALAHLGGDSADRALDVAQEAVRLAPARDTLHEIEGLLLTARALRVLRGKGVVGEIEDLFGGPLGARDDRPTAANHGNDSLRSIAGPEAHRFGQIQSQTAREASQVVFALDHRFGLIAGGRVGQR
ncbi:MAG: AAA family ATPase [Myxococcales bacterium]|nr:AAA family ATPase [Myxococcales bacterium]